MIVIDGVRYRVFTKLESLGRDFSFLEGVNADRAISGLEILDTIGTMYQYSVTIEPNLNSVEDYYALYEVISSPNRIHDVILPYNNSEISFRAKIDSGSDSLNGRQGIWRHLKINFIPIRPQRVQ